MMYSITPSALDIIQARVGSFIDPRSKSSLAPYLAWTLGLQIKGNGDDQDLPAHYMLGLIRRDPKPVGVIELPTADIGPVFVNCNPHDRLNRKTILDHDGHQFFMRNEN